MKIVFFSDTHGKHDEVILPSSDILVFCGDFSQTKRKNILPAFIDYFRKQDSKYKIMIAGNHDFMFEDHRRFESENLVKQSGIIYLNDSGIEIDNIKFWGSPIQPKFFDWAFNRERGKDIRKHWDLIPRDTNVLITHGPPRGKLDLTIDNQHAGCDDLRGAVRSVRPQIHAFGHIHESYGTFESDGVRYINAVQVDLKCHLAHKPISIEF